jgi:ornithine cyclodeaminase
LDDFTVITGTVARQIIAGRRREIIAEVAATYLTHHRGDTVNPDSYFLRFPGKPDARIIALPAYLGGRHDVAGIKWIASFPGNIASGLPRASAALLLNDYATGYPFALIEASQVSAARTAASAALAARVLTGGTTAGRVAIVGAGVIGRNILEFLAADGWKAAEIAVFDQVSEYADAMAGYARTDLGQPAQVAGDLAGALRGADLVILVTTAAAPYITQPGAFGPGTVVLNISLRDIAPAIIAASCNVLDDVEHCLKAGTSPHLAEQEYGHRDFIAGTLAQVMAGEAELRSDVPVIFSPFGLGVLDLAVGSLVYREAMAAGTGIPIPGFFAETTRW